MADSILVDTDVLIDFFKGHPESMNLIHTYSTRIILSSIAIAELYAGVKGDEEESTIEEFISLFRIVSVNTEIAKRGGLYKRDYGKSPRRRFGRCSISCNS